MNLPRRAAIFTILHRLAEQAADEIERTLFERDPDWHKPAPQIPPKTAPAGFAQANTEPPPRTLAPIAQSNNEPVSDTAAQFPPKFFTQHAAEQHLREILQLGDGLHDLTRLLKTYADLANDARALTEPQKQASPQEEPKTQEEPPRPPIGYQRQSPRPNPDNVWGAVHKLRERFGEEAASILIDALSGRMDTRTEKIVREEAEKIEAKRQADAKPDPIAARVDRCADEANSSARMDRICAELQRKYTQELWLIVRNLPTPKSDPDPTR